MSEPADGGALAELRSADEETLRHFEAFSQDKCSCRIVTMSLTHAARCAPGTETLRRAVVICAACWESGFEVAARFVFERYKHTRVGERPENSTPHNILVCPLMYTVCTPNSTKYCLT